jgi:alanyl-tRNA synthetase
MTTKLYYSDPYLQKFSSKVRKSTLINDMPAIFLEQSAFYPTSGGQPHDTGTINDIEVLDVYENESNDIVHILKQPVEDRDVVGRIYWERRFDHMQQHTGQHLLSQAFIKKCNADTISFHLGDESATLDLNQAGFSADTISAVEEFTNRIIYENRQVIGHIVSKNELDQFPVRKPASVEGNIRIIEIENFDYSPCGGTHCSRTGEIGVVKITRYENYKDGTRVHFKCGIRALREYQEKSKILKQIGEHLSTGEPELYRNIKKLQHELKSLRREHGDLKNRYLDHEAQTIFAERKDLENLDIISKLFTDRDPKDLKPLAQKLVRYGTNTIVLFGTKAGGKASLLFLRSEAIPIDMGKLMQQACAVIGGRGGGRPEQAQGGGPAQDKLEIALENAFEEISKGANLE